MSIATWRFRKELLWSGHIPNWKIEKGSAQATSVTAEVAQPDPLDSKLTLPILLILAHQKEEHEQVI
jgi:hypothetical protein